MTSELMRTSVASMLKGIDRYNPENLTKLERYVELQAADNTYDLEANLAVLKLYQFNPTFYKIEIVTQILLKALTNLPHTDFVLCKCLIEQSHLIQDPIDKVMLLAHLLETCQFKRFWEEITSSEDESIIIKKLVVGISGFEDSIRKFICHVVGITYQTIEKPILMELLGDIPDTHVRHWMTKYGWKELQDGMVFVASQEENIKTKNITENIDFESVTGIMAACR